MVGSDLAGQVALVTGGSRGIGRAVSIALARMGAFVFVNYTSNEGAAQEVVSKCADAGSGGAEALKFDVGKADEVDGAFALIKGKKERLDILVNNAGISRDGLLLRMKDEDWRATLNTNLDGAFFCTRAAAKLMVKARTGRIINVSSVVGEMGNAGQIPYASSKSGLIGMTKASARELASRGITVNSVTPGFIDTDMTAALDQGQKEHHMAQIPLGRFGSVDEVASLIVFLASPGSGYITGQVIGVNGGMYM